MKDYDGGLGLGQGNPSKEMMDVKLGDKKGLQIIYFMKTVFCRGMRIRVTDVYPGMNNFVHLEKVIIYYLL